MALPATFDSASPAEVSNANTADNALRALSLSCIDLFGVASGTSVAVAGFAWAAAGLTVVKFQDLAGSPATAGFLQRNGNNLEYYNSAARVLYMRGGTDVAVADGGTGLSSGTSGGILAFTGSTTLASSGALTASRLLVGGGAGVAPTVMAALANGQLPIGATGSAPSAGALTDGTNVTFAEASGTITPTKTDRVVLTCGISLGSGAFTMYASPYPAAASTTESEVTIPCPVTGTLTTLTARAICTSGSESVSIAARIAGSDALSTSLGVSASEASGSVTGSAAVSQGDKLTVKVVTGGALSGLLARFCLVIQATA